MKTLLCFGDSNTHGTMPMHDLAGMGRYSREHRWTGRLAALLPEWEVIAEGHPGRTTVYDDPVEGAHRNGRSALPAILESHLPIDAVLLMLGTNDLKNRFSVNAMDVALGLEHMVRMIRASGAGPMGRAPDVLVVAPPPIREVGCLAGIFVGAEAKSARLGAEIGAMAARNGCPFIDLADLIAVSAIDGIHYDPDANQPMAEAFAAALRQNFG